jgi:hypothetical protein
MLIRNRQGRVIGSIVQTDTGMFFARANTGSFCSVCGSPAPRGGSRCADHGGPMGWRASGLYDTQAEALNALTADLLQGVE